MAKEDSSQQLGGDKHKLVVPTNFSKKSELALDFALRHSQNINADIYVFHVFEEKISNFRQLDRLNEEYMERMKHTVMQAIDRANCQGIRHTVEDVHRRISHGKAWQEILKITTGVNGDMIIMGAPTSKQFKNLIAKTPCTMVLVKDKDPAFVA